MSVDWKVDWKHELGFESFSEGRCSGSEGARVRKGRGALRAEAAVAAVEQQVGARPVKADHAPGKNTRLEMRLVARCSHP